MERYFLRPIKEKSVNFNDTENLYIEGDNIIGLKVIRKSYLNKIKMIYIDPPYNTGNDFIYNDKFEDDLENRHTAWLNMIYPRLRLAKDLLREEGVIFISIDDNEVHRLREICDEIFGEENFVCEFIRKSGVSPRHDAKYISIEKDYILMYAKNKSSLLINKKQFEKINYYKLKDKYYNDRGYYKLNKLDRSSISYRENLDYPITAPDGSLIYPGGTSEKNGWCWRWGKEKLNWGLKNGFIEIKKGGKGWAVYVKQYQFVDNNNNRIIRSLPYKNLLLDNYFNEKGTSTLQKLFDNKKFFNYPKPVELIKLFINMATNADDIILDFFISFIFYVLCKSIKAPTM